MYVIQHSVFYKAHLCAIYQMVNTFCEVDRYLIYPYLYTHTHTNIYLYTYTRASLIAQLVKNPQAMQETLVRFLGQEDLLEKG